MPRRRCAGRPPRLARTGPATSPTAPTTAHTPASVDEVRQVVKTLRKLRALGTRHSFNAIADSTQNQISLKRLDQMTIDEKARPSPSAPASPTASSLRSSTRAATRCTTSRRCPHISVAGAIATATHGSGMHNGNLATAVSALEIVTANGEAASRSRAKDGDNFSARSSAWARSAWSPASRSTCSRPIRWRSRSTKICRSITREHISTRSSPAATASACSPTGRTTGHAGLDQAAARTRRQERVAAEFFGAKLATEKLHPIAGHDAESCTEQQGIPGPWYERLPHFRMNFTPSSGRELQTEYFVPRDRGYEAISRSRNCATTSRRICSSPNCAPSPPTICG